MDDDQIAQYLSFLSIHKAICLDQTMPELYDPTMAKILDIVIGATAGPEQFE